LKIVHNISVYLGKGVTLILNETMFIKQMYPSLYKYDLRVNIYKQNPFNRINI